MSNPSSNNVLSSAPPPPQAYALMIAVFYGALAAIYITVSDAVAQRFATSIESLARIQEMKGWVFVAVTTVALFFWSDFILGLARRQAEQRAEQLRLLDRRALAGVLASSVAHDIRNALTVVHANAELLRRGAKNDDERELGQDLCNAVDQIVGMVTRLRDSGNQSGRTPQTFELIEEVRQSLSRLRKHPRVQGCQPHFHGTQPIQMLGFRAEVDEIVANLVLNAADAVEGRGKIEVAVMPGATGGVLTVEDDGPGLPSSVRDRLFEPFTTTKPDGTGLGLVSVRMGAERHGGTVVVGKSSLGGARFTVTLPSLASVEPASSLVT